MYSSKADYINNLSNDYLNHLHIAVRGENKKGFLYKEYNSHQDFWNHYKTFKNNQRYFYEIIAIDENKPIPVRPYIDVEYYDNKVPPKKFQSELKKIILQFCKQKLNITPNVTIMDSSGYCTDKQCNKNSFHVLLRKIGLCNNVYECGILIKELINYIQIHGSKILTQRQCSPNSEELGIPIDTNVYKNSWQIMRLPYSIKGNRELMPTSDGKTIPFNKIKGNAIYAMFITCGNQKSKRIDVSSYIPKKNERKRKENKTPNYRLTNNYKQSQTSSEPVNKKLVEKLLECYSDKRCERFKHWIRVGIALFNYFKGDPEGFKYWTLWSKKCPEKFDINTCKIKWKEFKKSNLSYNIGSLIYWARRDDPEQFQKAIAITYNGRAYRAIGNDFRTAELIYDILKNEFVEYTDTKGVAHWYWFDGVYLVPDYDCTELKKRISTDIVDIYDRIKQHYTKKLYSLSDEETEDIRNDCKDKIKACTKMIYKLSSNGYKKSLIDECKQFFRKTDLQILLNNNPDIIVFNNGVYDLNELCFRGGCPEDYTNISCGFDFQQTQDTSDIVTFLKSVLYYNEVVHYTCKLLASCCSGRILDQLFHFLTGIGSNGKSTLLNIIDEAFGQYYTVTDANTLMGKNNDAGHASPHMYKLVHKRFVGISESSAGSINIERFKKITGNDKVPVRGLYRDEEDIRLQCKFIMICNDAPIMPSHDYATWRRIRNIHCPCKFVDNPTNEKEFKKNPRLGNQKFIKKLASQLMTLLLTKYYPIYLKEGLRDPPEIINKFTDAYNKDTNPYHLFAGEKLVETNDDNSFVEFKKLHMKFKAWFMAPESPFLRKKFPNNMKIIKDNFAKYYFHSEPEEVSINGKKTYVWKNFMFNEHFNYEYDE